MPCNDNECLDVYARCVQHVRHMVMCAKILIRFDQIEIQTIRRHHWVSSKRVRVAVHSPYPLSSEPNNCVPCGWGGSVRRAVGAKVVCERMRTNMHQQPQPSTAQHGPAQPSPA
jgi:hypothetical protein